MEGIHIQLLINENKGGQRQPYRYGQPENVDHGCSPLLSNIAEADDEVILEHA
jgi:hypothetical protein